MQHFDVEIFRQYLQTSWLGRECFYFDSIASTSSYLKKIPSGNLKDGTICLADYQFEGRGQYQRKWDATAGKNLTFTLCFKPGTPNRLPLLTLVCANAVLQTLENYMPGNLLRLKWPNDLMANGKKISGVLTEASFSGSVPEKVLVGIAVNIFETDFRKEIRGKAVSLSELSDKKLSREKILAEILLHTEQAYRLWQEQETSLQRTINNKMQGYGKWNEITLNGELQPGKYKFIGLGDSGELLLLNEDLDVYTFRHEQIRIIPNQKSFSPAAQEIKGG